MSLLRFWVATILVLLASCRSQPPTDAAVTRQLETHIAEFELLVSMVRADSKVGAIGRGFLFAVDKRYVNATPTQLGITEARVAEYRRLLGAVGALRLDRDGDDRVDFTVWASGFAADTHHKGVVWVRTGMPTATNARYSHVRGNWYVIED